MARDHGEARGFERGGLGVPGAEATGNGLGKSGWVTVPLATPKAPPFGVLTDWVEESYRLVAPKRLVAELDFAHR